MEPIATSKNQITLLYNSETSLGKQALAYVNNAAKSLRTINTSVENLTGKQWAGIADALGVAVNELIDKEHPDFTKHYNSDINLETNDWLKIIDKQPQTISGCILIVGDSYHHIINPSDISKYLEVDSAGVQRNPSANKE